jgi:hypothetical protein
MYRGQKSAALTRALPLTAASRLAHLCRSRPRGSIHQTLRPTLRFGATRRRAKEGGGQGRMTRHGARRDTWGT